MYRVPRILQIPDTEAATGAVSRVENVISCCIGNSERCFFCFVFVLRFSFLASRFSFFCFALLCFFLSRVSCCCVFVLIYLSLFIKRLSLHACLFGLVTHLDHSAAILIYHLNLLIL